MAVVAGGLIAGSTGTASADPAPERPAPGAAGWSSRTAERFWTPERMASATPLNARTGKAAATAGADGTRGPRSGELRAAGQAQHFGGIPSVGVLFTVTKDMKTHYCTAGVVHSAQRNLILTAGHCNPGRKAAFVPQYRAGAARQPHGVWAIERGFTDPRRSSRGQGSNYDFAFARVAPDSRGRSLEQVTGGNTLTRGPGYRNRVTVVGYPSRRNDPADRAIRCAVTTGRLTGYRQLRMECGGFHGGTSGSPWLAHYDAATRTGQVIGVLGGLNGGGPSGPHSDRVSYSPVFDAEVFRLYDDAVHNRTPRR
ncbi:trypsin-like serine peptidase [Streptomyces sp. NPDC001922]|uniref:trypsin-like serine peptidase n=1 Tax=Streptomyces sp. NPDC001922 TaxID=3364624 RepID=UPI0036B06A4E